MELPDIGQQCAQSNCKQLDFLPLHCKCGKQFCSEHFNLHIQNCELTDNIVTDPQKFENLYKCSREDCNETSLVPIICERCKQHFCIKHRHLTQCYEKDAKTIAEEKERLAAPVRKFNEAKNAVDKQIEQNLSEARKKGKNSNLVNKVQLMKIKNKAKGLNSISITDRIYFNIIHSTNQQGSPVFISKAWSIGRAIDAIANEFNLKNDNNKAGCKKLRLFKYEDKKIVSLNMADNMRSIINNGVIFDGETLIIEYVDDNCDSLTDCL